MLMFFKSSASFFKPFLVAGGQVFREEYFQGDMENLELTAPMCQLARLYSTMGGGVLDAKYSKPEMVATGAELFEPQQHAVSGESLR